MGCDPNFADDGLFFTNIVRPCRMGCDPNLDLYRAQSLCGEPELLTCTNNFYHFSFNSNNGRFVFSMIAGYVAGDEDTISVSYGKCDKF